MKYILTDPEGNPRMTEGFDSIEKALEYGKRYLVGLIGITISKAVPVAFYKTKIKVEEEYVKFPEPVTPVVDDISAAV